MQGLNVDMPVAPVMGAYNGGDDNFFKYLILLGLLNGGGGLFGGNKEAATTAAIANEGNWTTTIGKLDALAGGLSSLGYANLEGQNGIQSALSSGLCNLGYQVGQGFAGVDSAICSSTFALSKEVSSLAASMAACCCETNRNIDSVRYDMSRGFCDVVTAGNLNTRDIIASQTAGNQRIVDLINANTTQELRDRIGSLEAEKTALAFQASQVAQTCNIEKYVDRAIANSTETILKHIPYFLEKK